MLNKRQHNHKKIKIKYIGHSSYEKQSHRKDSVLGFLRVNFLFTSIIFICYSVGLYINQPELEFLSPIGGASVFGGNIEVQAQEVEVDKCDLIENDIEQYICEVFEDDYEDAMKILSCENKGLSPLAINDANSNGSTDVGIFQINSIHGFTVEEMQDYRANINFAHKLFKRDSWSAWACSHKLNIKSFWE